MLPILALLPRYAVELEFNQFPDTCVVSWIRDALIAVDAGLVASEGSLEFVALHWRFAGACASEYAQRLLDVSARCTLSKITDRT